jgi:hypothetical protein
MVPHRVADDGRTDAELARDLRVRLARLDELQDAVVTRCVARQPCRLYSRSALRFRPRTATATLDSLRPVRRVISAIRTPTANRMRMRPRSADVKLVAPSGLPSLVAIGVYCDAAEVARAAERTAVRDVKVARAHPTGREGWSRESRSKFGLKRNAVHYIVSTDPHVVHIPQSGRARPPTAAKAHRLEVSPSIGIANRGAPTEPMHPSRTQHQWH